MSNIYCVSHHNIIQYLSINCIIIWDDSIHFKNRVYQFYDKARGNNKFDYCY